MIKVEHLEVFNLDGAVRGMRNPMNSWDKSDSKWIINDSLDREFIIGSNDLGLMQRLYKAGSEHAKYLRQMYVSLDILAPIYWWKEADTYRVGVTTNSTSTMHKIHAKEFTLDDFSHEHLTEDSIQMLNAIVGTLNIDRYCYINSKNKDMWWQMIQLLPSSYNQKRTMTMSYANVMNMINQRENHKLDEWREFVSILRELPYIKQIRGEE